MEFRFLFLLLFSLILTSCEKKERTLSVEEAKKIYDRISDNEVRTHFREVILSQCHSKLNRLGNQVPFYVNKDNLCECVATSTIRQADIKLLRLALLPAEALTEEQKHNIDAGLAQKLIKTFPQCYH